MTQPDADQELHPRRPANLCPVCWTDGVRVELVGRDSRCPACGYVVPVRGVHVVMPQQEVRP